MRFSNDAFALLPLSLKEIEVLWDYKHTAEQLARLKRGDPYVYNAQYNQDPVKSEGNMFKDQYWKYYEELPNDIVQMAIFCDTAQKTKEHNDYTVFLLAAYSPSRGVYLVDLIRGKWESPQIESNLVDFWNKHKPTLFKRMGASCVYVEDKSSGSGLIQSIKQDYNIPIEAVQRNIDKIVRAMGVIKYFASGKVHVPAGAEWLSEFTDEFRKFNAMMTHKHDDQVDATMDAVEILMIFTGMMYTDDNLN